MPLRKVALVIGNEAYQFASKLDAPRGDALAMADLLEKIGFSVVPGFDCPYSQFRNLIDDFYDRLDPDAVALFYYSGHGAQAPDGSNHLLPVDAQLEDPRDLGRVTMPLNDLLRTTREIARISLIFLDACRDDPFAVWQRTTGRKGVFGDKPGLATVPRGRLGQALIGFAAEQGHTALDSGNQQRSPFTAALLNHLKKPGREIRAVMQDVRKDVSVKTDGRQMPWTNEALTEDLILVPNYTQMPVATTDAENTIGHVRIESTNEPPPNRIVPAAIKLAGDPVRGSSDLPQHGTVGSKLALLGGGVAVGMLVWLVWPGLIGGGDVKLPVDTTSLTADTTSKESDIFPVVFNTQSSAVYSEPNYSSRKLGTVGGNVTIFSRREGSWYAIDADQTRFVNIDGDLFNDMK